MLKPNQESMVDTAFEDDEEPIASTKPKKMASLIF